jgi:DNA-binding GntR family transcriptional regulator
VSEPLKRLEPIARDSVETRVAQAIRDLIVSGQLPEGTALVQRELGQRLGVSQTPVRIALGALQRAGLVEIGGTGRAVVSRLTREDLEETYAARLGLEGLAARVGVAAIGPTELVQMRARLTELERLARTADVDGYLRTRWEFHAACYRASRRKRLVAEVERLYWRSERYNRLVLSSAPRFRHSIRHYRDFFAAAKVGDAVGAERIIHDSVRWAVELIWPSLPSESELA